MRRTGLAICFLLLIAAPTRAVILYSSATRNTSAPTGAYAGSGWQYQGNFDGYDATVISKKFIITAAHIGGAVGHNFIFNGEIHRTINWWGDPNSDLRIYQTVGSYNVAAPFFKATSTSNEIGRSCVMIGRGTQRGDAVMTGGRLRGWKWGASDTVQSWGRNSISNIVTAGPHDSEVLQMTFDAGGVQYEGALSTGDSGGAVFIKQGTTWKLAGINFGADGDYSVNSNGSGPFKGSMFNTGQLWTQGAGYNFSANAGPGSSYATRVSSRLDWISGVLNGHIAPGIPASAGAVHEVPEPASALAVVILACAAMRRR